jgi:hypothetical protein
MFKKWCDKSDLLLSDRQIMDIIGYYYPTVEIEQDKFIHHIRCVIWDKQMDIQIALEHHKEILRESFISSVAIYDMYLQYCKYYSGIDGCVINPAPDGSEIFRRRESKSMIVSKSYFDKYILETMSEFVIDSTIVSSNWYMINHNPSF